MRVFIFNGSVINCDTDDPQVETLIAQGEEIPIGIFGDHAHLADNNNTKKNELGEWVFDSEAVVASEIARATEERRAEILAQLDSLDQQSSRPLRAIAAGTSTDDDTARLVEIEAQAVDLRRELAGLSN